MQQIKVHSLTAPNSSNTNSIAHKSDVIKNKKFIVTASGNGPTTLYGGKNSTLLFSSFVGYDKLTIPNNSTTVALYDIGEPETYYANAGTSNSVMLTETSGNGWNGSINYNSGRVNSYTVGYQVTGTTGSRYTTYYPQTGYMTGYNLVGTGSYEMTGNLVSFFTAPTYSTKYFIGAARSQVYSLNEKILVAVTEDYALTGLTSSISEVAESSKLYNHSIATANPVFTFTLTNTRSTPYSTISDVIDALKAQNLDIKKLASATNTAMSNSATRYTLGSPFNTYARTGEYYYSDYVIDTSRVLYEEDSTKRLTASTTAYTTEVYATWSDNVSGGTTGYYWTHMNKVSGWFVTSTGTRYSMPTSTAVNYDYAARNYSSFDAISSSSTTWQKKGRFSSTAAASLVLSSDTVSEVK